MENFKKPYEISLWEDILTFVVDNDGVITEYEGTLEGAVGTVVAQYYKERKICVIGSNTMNTPIRAFENQLVSNVNGSNTLTFKMVSHYWDEESQEIRQNPFLKLLVNERKIKVRDGAFGEKDTKWYDLVIKNVSEDSETKVFIYTAKDLFINELSKSGFNLEFDVELENNTGTVIELGEKILAESDWQIAQSKSDIIRQYIEEPLYEIILSAPIEARDMINNEETLNIEAGKTIYAFYNCIVNKTPYFQFLYSESGNFEVDDDFVIVSESNWFIDNIQYDEEDPVFASSKVISNKYRGKRLVRKAKTKYDATVDKYVAVYKDGDKEVYGFVETDYTSPASARSFITNGTGFTSDIGWSFGGANSSEGIVFPELEVVSVPDIRDVDTDEILDGDEINTDVIKTYLKFNTNAENQSLINSGIADYRQYIENFTENEKYILRVKYGQADEVGVNGAKTLKKPSVGLKFQVCEYTISEGIYTPSTIYFEGTLPAPEEFDYTYIETQCLKSLEYSQMILKPSLGLIIIPESASSTLYFEDIQFFKYIPDEEGFILPDELGESKVVNTYYYYYPNQDYKSVDDIQYIYKGTTPAPFVEVFNEDFEKVRSITARESNRFNLIQDLCEIFECWARFEIDHNIDGSILLDQNYRPQKRVSFHEYVGKNNFAGFKYGINLKQIQRDIESETITSKIIVKNNQNEFGKNGFCSIARAEENPSGENYILDFSYYIQQGMLGLAELTNDLYLDVNGYIGFYKKLREINDLRNLYIEEQAKLLTTISEYESSYQTYNTLANEADEQLTEQLIYITNMTGYTFKQLMDNRDYKGDNDELVKISEWWDNNKAVQILSSIGYLKTVATKYKAIAEKAKTNLDSSKARYDELTRIISSRADPTEEQQGERRLLTEKEELNKQFYKKYSRFLQEGSWISEDYLDDELYYLDACGVARTSSQPQINYTINTIEVSQIEGYENFKFSIGDKTTIEDTEFFGWVIKDGLKTPYREEVVVSEITVMFDSPDQNVIKVQNYKTQFEDLFQRMAAATQSVEYSTGKYNKVSNIIEPSGLISVETLQNSIANNALVLSNARDQSVIWDETGITTTSLRSPAEMVRIVSGGIFLSVDGGITWNTGLTGKGINANYITSGQINTGRINILNGAFPSFRWDGAGISAYKFELNQETREVTSFDSGRFVRLDQYGLYGINGYPDFDSSIEENGLIGEEKIWNKADFALTWKGFSLKSKRNQGGYISITSDEDFQVFNKEGREQVKIGLLSINNENPVYGLRIRDGQGNIVLEHSSIGEVWIRNSMKIGNNKSTVEIGYLDGTKKEKLEVHEVINADDKFIVYEDGSMRATDGDFTGVINATGGQIGGVDIGFIVGSVATEYEVQIESDSGTIFKNGKGEKILTARIFQGFKEVTEGIAYQWYEDNIPIAGANNKNYTAIWPEGESETEKLYSCKITVQ